MSPHEHKFIALLGICSWATIPGAKETRQMLPGKPEEAKRRVYGKPADRELIIRTADLEDAAAGFSAANRGSSRSCRPGTAFIVPIVAATQATALPSPR
jgi:hypothetical protein